MPTIPLHLPPITPTPKPTPSNPLPPLLHTPTGLAILEMQGTLHLPNSPNSQPSSATTTPIGRLTFPDYSPHNPTSDEKWMKRVYLYVGRHQRLVGEVRRLERAVGVLRRREDKGVAGLDGEKEGLSGEGEGVEVLEVVYWKVLFGGRAEIVG